MSAIKDGGPAFPREDYQTDDAPGQRGMSLRDWFAGNFMATQMQMNQHNCNVHQAKNIALFAYQVADAMLAAREVQS